MGDNSSIWLNLKSAHLKKDMGADEDWAKTKKKWVKMLHHFLLLLKAL